MKSGSSTCGRKRTFLKATHEHELRQGISSKEVKPSIQTSR